MVRMDSLVDPQLLFEGPRSNLRVAVSPDGRWLAYQSGEDGSHEIYVTRFPSLDGKWQISTGGGTEPRWSADGKTLYFRDRDRVMTASIEHEPELRATSPEVRLSGLRLSAMSLYGWSFAVSSDEERIFIVQSSAANVEPNQIHVIVNWLQEVAAKVQAGSRE